MGTWSGPKWTSIMDITTVLLTLQSLLDENPLHHEPGQEKNIGHTNILYNEIIKYESLNTLLLKNYFDTHDSLLDFKDEMKGEIEKVGVENIIKHTKELCERNKDSYATVPIYRINTNLNYSHLSKDIERLENEKVKNLI